MSELRKFDATHIEEDCTNLRGEHRNKLFYGCSFDNLSGLTLKDCVLNQSEFKTESVSKALGFTMTLNCHSFRGLKLSSLLFDLLLYMLTLTVGNDEKREAIRQMLGPSRTALWDRLLKRAE